MDRNEKIEEHIRNFLLQWEYFPFPALMIRRDRTVLAANPVAEKVGLTASIRCCDSGSKESHRDCLADCALSERSGKRLLGYSKEYGAFLDSYWLPVADLKDVYIHFSIDISSVANPALFPPEADQ